MKVPTNHHSASQEEIGRKIAPARTAAKRRRLTRVAAVVLFGTLALGLGGLASALIGNGFMVWQWGTTKDQTGINIGSGSNRTCFLSGVAGNLNVGGQWYKDEPSSASVYQSGGNYWLAGHGGAYTNDDNHPVWQNNPVNAQATCFWTVTAKKYGSWGGFNGKAPVKLAELSTGNTNVRQCFLSGLVGVGGSWNNSSNFARVVQRTVVDATHPTTGWYIEANLPDSAGDGSHPSVSAACVEFPQGTIISTGSVSAAPAATTTTAITSGAGVKACALTGIVGAWKVNNWTDGAMMTFPAQIDGNWSLTVKNGKTAQWACAR